MFRKLLFLTTLMIAVLALSACGANISLNLFTAEETVTQSFAAAGTARLVVEMFNGSIEVVTAEDNTLKIDVIKRGGGGSQWEAEDDLKNVAVTMTQDGDTIRVVARRSDQRIDLGNSGASAKLRVPAGTILDLRSSNGAIVSAGPVGDLKAQTSNGAIEVRSSQGQLDLNTSNGGITINGGRGLLNLETSNGRIDVTADNVMVNGRTSNGGFHFTGSLAAGRSEMRTSNGGLVVTLPADTQFIIDAETSNAKIDSDFAVTTQDFSDNRLSGTVGSDPDVTLELHTSNGGIDLRRSR
ncbi:hypothetical protein TFLX_05017 [Thermoflexales bacterium]|nr:hypothetical protein TFLX_05017 [Thermoflexales bacterium]